MQCVNTALNETPYKKIAIEPNSDCRRHMFHVWTTFTKRMQNSALDYRDCHHNIVSIQLKIEGMTLTYHRIRKTN